MDRTFSIDKCARDDSITLWMHTYSGLVRIDNEGINKGDAQTDSCCLIV